jgi:16S rRNA (guanine527-N7)-methyltransferase
MLTNLQIERLLRGYGAATSPELTVKFNAYIELLLKWNRKIALTTVTDPEEIVKFHFGESLFATSHYNLENSRLADVGTGAGFPGLALALAIPTLSVTLIESNLKKCAFL